MTHDDCFLSELIGSKDCGEPREWPKQGHAHPRRTEGGGSDVTGLLFVEQ